MLIDIHTHLWGNTVERSKREILSMCERFGIDRVLVSSLLSCVPDEEEIERLNDYTASFMRENPSLVRGYCYLNPRNGNTLSELRRRIEEDEMCGVKLWVATYCDDPLVNPIVEEAIRYGVPVLVHTFHKAVGQLPFESLGENLARLAKRYPEGKFIMAHLGANCLRELRVVRDCPNVWADFSGSIAHADDLEYAKRILGADRLLFGSDMPALAFQTSYGQLLEGDLTEAERRKIMGENALALFSGRNGL